MLTATTSKNSLTLYLTDVDRKMFEQALSKWKFKDEQRMMRFVMGMLLLNEDKNFSFSVDGVTCDVDPSDEILND